MLTLKKRILATTEKVFARAIRDIYTQTKSAVRKEWFNKLIKSLSTTYALGKTRSTFYGQTMPFLRSGQLKRSVMISLAPKTSQQIKIRRVGSDLKASFKVKGAIGPAKRGGFDYSKLLNDGSRLKVPITPFYGSFRTVDNPVQGYRSYAFEKLGDIIERTIRR